MRVETLSKAQREQIQNKRESQYEDEIPLLQQTFSWQEGMKYRYSPDDFEITARELCLMPEVGESVGETLSLFSPRIIEFRLDMVGSLSGGLFITEIQTDDRGLPAMAIARNARGNTQKNILPGVVPSFIKAVKSLENKEPFLAAIVYPDSQYFYSAGFNDFCRLCWAFDPENKIIAVSRKQIASLSGSILTVNLPGTTTGKFPVDYIWDFSETIQAKNLLIQPRITKEILLQVWDDQSPEAIKSLRKFIPLTSSLQNTQIGQSKDNWVLKPIDGKWSKGVVFGKDLTQTEWEQTIVKNKTNGYLAQKFIEPRTDWVLVRNKNENYGQEAMVARIEGYYFKTQSGWALADILVTLTKDLPVHGKRDCVMIPGKII